VAQNFIPKVLKSGIANKMQQIRQCVGFPKMFLQEQAVIKYYDSVRLDIIIEKDKNSTLF